MIKLAFVPDAIVWSHWHWDHIGDASKFPDSVDLVVGPGFKENLLPGWPENLGSPLLTKDLASVTVCFYLQLSNYQRVTNNLEAIRSMSRTSH